MAPVRRVGRDLAMGAHPKQELDHRWHQRDYARPAGLPGCLMFLEHHGPLLKMHIRPAHASGFPGPAARELQEDQESAKCRIGTSQKRLEFVIGHRSPALRTASAAHLREGVTLNQL